MTRKAEVERVTAETSIRLKLDVDGSGNADIQTGIGFLDHMLEQVAFHGMFDLELYATGDLHVDQHHTIEDCALTLGQAFDRALAERTGINRMGWAYVPMDDSLSFVAFDMSGRPYSVIDVEWLGTRIGGFPTSLIEHFLASFSITARCNLHAQVLYGIDDHHKAEAIFKAFGRALRDAVSIDERRANSIPSTKRIL